MAPHKKWIQRRSHHTMSASITQNLGASLVHPPLPLLWLLLPLEPSWTALKLTCCSLVSTVVSRLVHTEIVVPLLPTLHNFVHRLPLPLEFPPSSPHSPSSYLSSSFFSLYPSVLFLFSLYAPSLWFTSSSSSTSQECWPALVVARYFNIKDVIFCELNSCLTVMGCISSLFCIQPTDFVTGLTIFGSCIVCNICLFILMNCTSSNSCCLSSWFILGTYLSLYAQTLTGSIIKRY